MSGVQVIAEVGLAHDGSLALAHAYAEACAAAGVDIIKFQLHLPEEGTDSEPFRVKITEQDHLRSDYWRRTGFHISEWRKLRDHVEQSGRRIMVSTFCEEAVAWAHAAGIRHFKVPSGQMNNLPMMRAIEALKPEHIYMATGLADHMEIVQALQTTYGTPRTLLHCVTQYPTPPRSWRLAGIGDLRLVHKVPVGLSDHSGTITAGLIAAAAHGATAIEVHVTFDKRIKLPDSRSSLTFDQLANLVQGIRDLDASRNPLPIDEREVAAQRRTYMPSVVAKTFLKEGTVIDLTHLLYKKTGETSARWEDVVGRTLRHDVMENHLFTGREFKDSQCAASA